MTQLGTIEYGVEIHDNDVDRQMAAANARVEAGLRRIDAKEAQFEIRANLKTLQKDLAEANAMVKKFEKERAALGESEDKRGAANRLKAAKAERDEKEKLLRVAQQAGMARAREVHDMQLMAERQNVLLKGERERGRLAKENAGNPEKETLQVLKLHKEYAKLTDEAEKLNKARKRAFTSETKQKVDIDEKIVFAKMALIKKTLSTMGREPPVHIKVDTNFDIRSPVRSLGRLVGNTIGNLGEKLANIGNLRLNLGPISGTIRTFAIALATLGPLVTSLTAGLGALVGVVGTGLAGAGAIGAAALTGLGLSAAGLFLTIKPLATQFKTASTATSAYTTAVLKYGEGSKQAKKAQDAMNNTLKGVSPEVRNAAKELAKMQTQWAKLTGGKDGAQHNLGAILADGFKTAGALMPTLAKGTNELSKNLRSGFGGIFEQLRSQGAKSGIATIMENFNKAIVPALGGLQNFGTALGRIAVSASRFLTPAAMGFQQLGQRFANSTADSDKLDKVINRLADHAQSLIRFFGAAGRVLVHFFDTGAASGQKLVDRMTAALNRWDAFIKSTKGQADLHDFFERGANGTLQLVHALGPLLKAFVEWSNALQPITTGILHAITWVTKLIGGLTHLAVFKGPLEALGITIAAAFAVNKIAAFVNMIRTAVTTVGGLIAKWKGVTAAEVEATAAARVNSTVTSTTGAGAPGRGRTPAPPPRGSSRFPLVAGPGTLGAALPTAAVLASDAQQVSKGKPIPSLSGGFNRGIGQPLGLPKLPGIVNFAGPLLPVTGAIAGINALGKAFGIFDSGSKKANEFNNVLKRFSQGKISLAQATAEIQKLGQQTGKPAQVARSMQVLNNSIGALRNGAAGSLSDLRQRFTQNFNDIKAVTGNNVVAMRHTMDENMNAAFHNLSQLLNDGKKHTALYLGQVKDIFDTNWRQTGRITKDNLNNVVQTIREGMGNGTVNVKKGMKAIHDYTVQYLTTTLHIQPHDIDVALARGGSDLGSITSGGGGTTGTGGSGRSGGNAATGWIGNPRAAGADNIGITVGEGEAVINRHQIPIVDHALYGIGVNGLAELFQRVQVPHSHEVPGVSNQGRPKWFEQGGFASGGPITIRSGAPVGGIETEVRGLLETGAAMSNRAIKFVQDHAGTVPQIGKAPNPRLTSLGLYLQKQGFSPGEHPNFGGVHPGHETYGPPDHYHGGAMDVGAIGAAAHHKIQAIAWMDHMQHHLDFWGPGMITTHPSTPVSWSRADHWDHVHISAHQKGGFAGQKLASGGFVTPKGWGGGSVQDGNNYDHGGIGVGRWAAGTASEFSGAASGVSTPFAGAKGGYWLLHNTQDDVWSMQPQTDVGPNLSLRRMFDFVGAGKGWAGFHGGLQGGFQGLYMGHSTHGYHVGRLGKGQGRYLASQFGGGGVGAGKMVTMWDDRTMASASHPAAYWKRMDSKQPRARAHWHTTKRAAQKIFDRNRARRTAAAAPTATTDPNRSNADNPNIVTGNEYPDLDLTIAREGGLDATTNPQGTPAERQALRDRIARDTTAINSDEGLLAFYEGIRRNHYKWGTTKQDKGFIDNSITSLQTSLTGLYGDRKSAQDILGPMDLSVALGITGASGADSGAGSAADNADLTAQLAQANTKLLSAQRDSQINAAFAAVAGGPGDLGMAGFTSARMAAQQTDRPTIIIQTLHPGDPKTLMAVANAATAGMGYQGGRTSPRDATI